MFTHLPIAFQISGHFLRRLATIIESPLSVFLICNAIIVTLIVKSGIFAAEKNADENLYPEILKSNDQKSVSEIPLDAVEKEQTQEQEAATLFQDKEIIVSPVKSIAVCQTDDAVVDSKKDVVFYSSESESEVDKGKVFRRTRSENMQRRRGEKASDRKKLQRSETEKSRKMVKACEEREEEEDLSDEEFQRAVEEFIAKNLRLRRQETLGVVLQRQSSVAQFELRSEIVIN
ncbi:hypothetical protein LINPERPRIM_LOCUS2521 [Linum perenne]